MIVADAMTLDQAKGELVGFSIAEITAGAARGIGLIVARDPVNRWHGLIYRRDSPGARMTKGQAKQLAQAGTLVHVEPAPPLVP